MKKNTRFVSVGLLVLATFALGGWSNPTLSATVPSEMYDSLSAQGIYVKGAWGTSDPRSANFKDKRGEECFQIDAGLGMCSGRFNNLDDGTATEIGVGLNFRSLPGARADITYGWEGTYRLKGTDPAGTTFRANLKAETLMLNFYYELAMMNMGPFRPFGGVGIGMSRNKLGRVKWSDVGFAGSFPGGTNTDFAWHATLGIAMHFHKNFVLELMYRYFDKGQFEKHRGADRGDPFGYASGQTGRADGNLEANELLFGVRFIF